jgi:hypothetical protein
MNDQDRLKAISEYNGAKLADVIEFYESVKEQSEPFMIVHDHFAKIRIDQITKAKSCVFVNES